MTLVLESFPARLVDWAGHRSGGVRRLFDGKSGRPSGAGYIPTTLLERLKLFAYDFAKDEGTVPTIILLVGGPGNGKTEAIELLMEWIDDASGSQGSLVADLTTQYSQTVGERVPRLVTVSTASLGTISIVQDASVGSTSTHSPAQLLLEELKFAMSTRQNESTTGRNLYVCCVNRGILDEALMEAFERGDDSQELLETITESVSMDRASDECWPLHGSENVAVWPMDVESLFFTYEGISEPAALEVMERALCNEKWSAFGTCAAGRDCPFCSSQNTLSEEGVLQNLLFILAAYELKSGKRWSFRDLFSVTSYLLSGHRAVETYGTSTPCSWARTMLDLHEEADGFLQQGEQRHLRASGSSALFHLVASQYQNALFHHWEWSAAVGLKKKLDKLGLLENSTAVGLLEFLESRRSGFIPTTIAGHLKALSETLDPALVQSDVELPLMDDTGSRIRFRDIDVRFSRSVSEGLQYISQYTNLTQLELLLLSRLASLDNELDSEESRLRAPADAKFIQGLIRSFACRLVRRSVGVIFGIIVNRAFFDDYRQLVEGCELDGLDDLAEEIEDLFNGEHHLEVSLTTTFGQPLPPPAHRATLLAEKQNVSSEPRGSSGRPRSPMLFLKLGNNSFHHRIALTYDLYEAVRELRFELSSSALPANVLALLDMGRSRLWGSVVRDARALGRAPIILGDSDARLVKRAGGFVHRETEKRAR